MAIWGYYILLFMWKDAFDEISYTFMLNMSHNALTNMSQVKRDIAKVFGRISWIMLDFFFLDVYFWWLSINLTQSSGFIVETLERQRDSFLSPFTLISYMFIHKFKPQVLIFFFVFCILHLIIKIKVSQFSNIDLIIFYYF